MADRKITDLTALAAGSQATGDLLTIVDVSESAAADKNKKITVESLFQGIPGNVGIGVSAPSTALDVQGSGASIQVAASGQTNARVRIVGGNTSSSFLEFGDSDDSDVGEIVYDHSNNSMRFNTSASERMRIDSSGNIGIGTTSPSSQLTISNAAAPTVTLIDTTNTCTSFFASGNTEGRVGTSSNHDFVFRTNNSERMRISSGGSVGIGTSNPQAPFTISNGGVQGIEAGYSSGTSTNFIQAYNRSSSAFIQFDVIGNPLVFKTGSGATERMRLTSDGKLGLGTSSPAFQSGAGLHVHNSGGQARIHITNHSVGATANDGVDLIQEENTDFHIINHEAGALKFGTNETERMRIDSSGNLGIGTASPTQKLDVRGSVYVGTNIGINTTSPTERLTVTGGNIQVDASDRKIGFKLSGNSNAGYLIPYTSGGNTELVNERSGGSLIFKTANTERMRIDSSGRLMVGTTTSKSTEGKLQAYTSSGDLNLHIQSDGLASGNAAYLNVNAKKSGGSTSYNAQLGLYKHSGINDVSAYLNLSNLGNRFMWNDSSGNFRTSTSASHIGTTSGTVVGTQTSDERLKNVGADVAYGLTEVKQLQAKQYALKTDPDTNKLGFIAQQVESIIPEAVFDTNEELDGHQEGDRTKLGMEYVQLIPVLVNAIKELSAEVDTLKTKVAALEAG
tara:strand:- start:1967 stop:4000 length:2034 start_codon:yes stop_codon:yes gene_type:complete